MGRLLFFVQTQMPPYSRRAVLESAQLQRTLSRLLVYRWRLGDDDEVWPSTLEGPKKFYCQGCWVKGGSTCPCGATLFALDAPSDRLR
jgi:hypothetical protein